MRKSLFVMLAALVALLSAVLSLAWINFRRGRSAPRPARPSHPSPRPHHSPRPAARRETLGVDDVDGGSPRGGGEETPGGDSEPDRCAAVTGSGRRCSRPAQEGSPYCWQHGD